MASARLPFALTLLCALSVSCAADHGHKKAVKDAGAGSSGEPGSDGAASSNLGRGDGAVASDATTARGDMHDNADAGRDRDASLPIIESPWGIASSASSSRALGSWAAAIHATGIDWLRGFDSGSADARLKDAENNGLSVSGILAWSPASAANFTFPVDDLSGWTHYVTDLVTRCKGRVGNWEIWNEPPNFTENKTPDGYAKIVVPAYDAVKAVDAKIQVGLAAQSNHVQWLEQTILSGAKDHFDYLTVHPYEILGLVEQGFEGEFMAIVPTLRKMLAKVDPKRAQVPIWFTEIGEPVQGAITAEHQAQTLIKAYTMGIAEGVKRIHWFEGIDGDSGPFGLLDGSSQQRPSYTAMKQLITQLGSGPRYLGLVLLNDRHYGFVFQGAKRNVMVAWARPGVTESVSFTAPVDLIDPLTGMTTHASQVALSNAPVIVSGVPAALVSQAKQNAKKPFPWGGDYSHAKSVSYAADSGEAGLHLLGKAAAMTIAGKVARDQSTVAGQGFTVDPNFLSYDSAAIEIKAVLRRKGADSAGFNLKYESQSGQKSTGSWYTIPGSDQWYTQTWTISDDEFVGKWGFNFSFDSDATTNSKYLIESVTVTKL